jgi:hypothetical protein
MGVLGLSILGFPNPIDWTLTSPSAWAHSSQTVDIKYQPSITDSSGHTVNIDMSGLPPLHMHFTFTWEDESYAGGVAG